MSVQLSSLRVDVTADSSSYVTAMGAVDVANRQMAASSQLAGAQLAQQDAAVGTAGAALGGLQIQMLAMAAGVAAAGAVGLGAFLGWVQKTNTELADMGDSAKKAGLNLADFQKLQFTAGSSGLSSGDFTSGAEKMAAQLDEAGRKENDLSKLLKANNVDLKDSNGILISNNKLWDVARDLISRAKNVWQAGTMADNLGLNDKFVPMLSQGEAAFKSLQDEAAKLNLLIGKDIIASAKKFDDEWRKSSLVFSTFMKAQIADLMPSINDLITEARVFVDVFKPGSQSKTQKELVGVGFMPDPSSNVAADNLQRWKDIYAIATDPGPTDRIARQGLIWQKFKDILESAPSKSGIVDDTKAMNDFAAGWEGMSAASKQYDVSGNTTSGVFDLIKQKATAAGLTIQQTSALMAAAQAESSMGTNLVGDKGTSFGLFQFHQGGELDTLKQYASTSGKDWQDFGTQIDYVIQKAQGGTDTFSKMWKSASSDADASKAMDNFEKFQGYLVSGNTESQKRITLTQQYDQTLRSGAGIAGGAGAANQYSNLIPEPDKAAQWDRAVDAVNRHIAVMAADSLAVGKSVADTDQLKAEFQLLEGARRADKGVTDDQIKQYTDLRANKTADQALDGSGIKLSTDRRTEFDKLTNSIKLQSQSSAELKIANQISFGQQTAFLSPQDVQIATQLKTIIPDVGTALASSYASAMRFNDAMHTLSGTIENNVVSGLDSIVMHTSSTGDAFRKMGSSVVSALDQMILKILVIEPLMRSLQGAVSSSGLLGFLGLGGASSSLASSNAAATGAAASDLKFAFANGGVMTSRGALPLNYYAGGGVANSPQLAMFGEGRSPEAYVPLPDGRSIPVNINVPKGAGSSGPVTNISPVYNIDARGSTMTEAQFQAILAKNNAQLAKDINNSLPDRVAAINRDPRRR